MSDKKDEDSGLGCLGLIIIFAVIGGINKCNEIVDDWKAERATEHRREVTREARNNVMSFLKDMNPYLHKKVKIYSERNGSC